MRCYIRHYVTLSADTPYFMTFMSHSLLTLSQRSSEGNEARVAGGDIYTIVLEFSVAFQLHGHIEETLPGIDGILYLTTCKMLWFILLIL